MPVQLDYRGKPRTKYQTVNELPSNTVISDQKKADINHILKRYKSVGIIDHLNLTAATYQDVTKFSDFADVMRTAKAAETEFMQLPSKVREAFDHDVANWLDTAHDPEKRQALVDAGLIEGFEPNPNGDSSTDPPGDVQPPAVSPDPA